MGDGKWNFPAHILSTRGSGPGTGNPLVWYTAAKEWRVNISLYKRRESLETVQKKKEKENTTSVSRAFYNISIPDGDK